MKKVLSVLISVLFFYSASAQTTLSSEIDSLSYAIGISFGQNLKSNNVGNANVEAMTQAMKDVLSSSTLAIPQAEASAFIQAYFKDAAAKVLNESLAAGNAYLAKNKEKEGVQVTASGLQYEILTAGTGAKPLSTQRVKVHYHGTLIDGTVFDSSVDRGTPSTFGVTQVIQGWVEGLQLMPIGSKWRFTIPAGLAYGTRGQGKIAPNSALIFDIELIEIL